jgi:hypothetical protein
MEQRFSILGAVGVTVAVMLGLAIYATLDLLFQPNALAAHERPPKGSQEAPAPTVLSYPDDPGWVGLRAG